MGNVLHLRKPRQKLGYDDVIFVPRESNTEAARAILARPDENTETMLRAACIWLRDNGDWLDQERARHLLRVLDAEARVASRQEHWLPGDWHELLQMGLIIVVVVIALTAFDAAWGQHLAAGVVK